MNARASSAPGGRPVRSKLRRRTRVRRSASPTGRSPFSSRAALTIWSIPGGPLWRLDALQRDVGPMRFVFRALFDPTPQQRFLIVRQFLVRPDRGHGPQRFRVVQPRDQLARLGVAGDDDAGLNRRLAPIEPQARLPGGAVGSVAAIAILGKDGPDIAIEPHRLRARGCRGRGQGKKTGEQGDHSHGASTALPEASLSMIRRAAAIVSPFRSDVSGIQNVLFSQHGFIHHEWTRINTNESRFCRGSGELCVHSLQRVEPRGRRELWRTQHFAHFPVGSGILCTLPGFHSERRADTGSGTIGHPCRAIAAPWRSTTQESVTERPS